MRHWSTRDAERIVARYADDTTVMAPNMAPAIGREAIREMVKQLVRDGNFALTFDVPCVEVARSGDLGFDQEASYRPGYLSQGLSQATGWCVESAAGHAHQQSDRFLAPLGLVVLHLPLGFPRDPPCGGLQTTVRRCTVFLAHVTEICTEHTAGKVAAQSTGRTIGGRRGTQE